MSLSYDQAYETRVSGNVKYRFGGNGYRSPSKKHAQSMPVIQALTATSGNRDVRVHDAELADLLIANGLAYTSNTPKEIEGSTVGKFKESLRCGGSIYINSGGEECQQDHRRWIDILSLSWGAGRSVKN